MISMAKDKYNIEQVPQRPIFLITWGASRSFTPNDNDFIDDVNDAVNAFGRPVSLIIDASQFVFTVGKAMENIIQASNRPDAIPKNVFVERIVLVSNNRFVHLMVSRLTKKYEHVDFNLTRTLDEAYALLEI